MPMATARAAPPSIRRSRAKSPIRAISSTRTSTTHRTPMARSAASCAAGRSASAGARRPSRLRLRLVVGVAVSRRRLADIAKAFLEALEESAQPVDRGNSECLPDLAGIDVDMRAAAGAILFVGRILALSRRLAAGGADRGRSEFTNDRARAHLDRLVGG